MLSNLLNITFVISLVHPDWKSILVNHVLLCYPLLINNKLSNFSFLISWHSIPQTQFTIYQYCLANKRTVATVAKYSSIFMHLCVNFLCIFPMKNLVVIRLIVFFNVRFAYKVKTPKTIETREDAKGLNQCYASIMLIFVKT